MRQQISVEYTCCRAQEYWDLNANGDLEMTHKELGHTCTGSTHPMILQDEIASMLYRNKYVQDQTLHLNRYELADAILTLVRERILSDEAVVAGLDAFWQPDPAGGMVDAITAALDAALGASD
jgi:hypothetical protein